jgi:hypothetical protein
MDQLTVVNSHSDRWISVLENDPVRPHIGHWLRVASNRECFVIHSDIFIKSVLCVAYIGAVPSNEDDLFEEWAGFNVASFYSVWSFHKGYGRKIVQGAINHIRWNRPYVTRAVTLSPKTDTAFVFHTSNGAQLVRENQDSVNFEYPL